MRATTPRLGCRTDKEVRCVPRTPGSTRRAEESWAGQSGQGMIEYALIGGILIVGAVAVLAALSKNLNDLFSAISSTLAQY